MKQPLTLSVVFAAFALTLAGRVAATPGTATRRADVLRTVYFSAVDAKGVPVTDLTAADLTVKEGGKDRPIPGVQAATAPLQVSLLVDDAGTGAFQAAVAQFLQATLGHAQFAISVLNPQPMKVANFTEDVDALKSALGRMGQRGKVSVDGEQIIEAVGAAARELQQRKAARPAIVVLSVSGETALSDRADQALSDLKSSGASLSVLYIRGIELGRVLGDGPQQSGGMIQQASGSVPLGPVLAKIADNLMHQYVLTYTIPDGVKLNEKLQLATTRKGVTLLAPTRLPDKQVG
jgi:hypothetical protein